ncbi:MAG TPA: PAS domain S-box protein [Methanoregulaceae archaeon]|nr:PAS domain S-box protein [Methanoregulaceae archaeon]HQJ88803.1 PAS domain S-box protein [Methanoregulaceae archaeon]
MKLRSRTILTLVLQLVVATLVISAFVTVFSIENYSNLERQYVLQDLDQARYRVSEEASVLSALVSDWAPWDDTYAFAGGDDPDYVRSNLMPEEVVYHNLRINLVAITDRQGRLLYAGAYDSRNRTMVPLPGAISRELEPGRPLANVTDPAGGTAGILMIEGRPLVVAARPIVRTDFSGEPRGVVLMGRYLDPGAVVPAGSRSGPSLRMVPVNDPGLSPAVLTALSTMTPGPADEVIPLDDGTIAGYTVLQDVHGDDALVLELTRPRGIFQQGVQTTAQVILVLLGIWIVSGGCELFILDRLVLSRLGSLRGQVRRAVDDRDASRRIAIGGDDELFDLAEDINQTLETIHTTQARLVASESRFRGMADLLPQVIFELDADGRLTYTNGMGLAVFGLDAGDLDRHPPARDFIAPDDHERLRQQMDLLLSGGVTKGEIYTMVRKDGTRIRAFINAAPIRENGIPVGIRGSIFDLSERLALEEALVENQEYLRSLLSSAPAGILVVDREDGQVLDANPAALALIGAGREQVVGRPVGEIVRTGGDDGGPGPDLPSPTPGTEGILLTHAGEERSVLMTAAPVTLSGQRCMLLGFMDNTERHRVEEKLRQSTELISGILQASPIGVFRVDSGGRFVFANEMCNRILGLPPGALDGRNWEEVLALGENESISGYVGGSVSGRRVMRHGETRYLTPGGGRPLAPVAGGSPRRSGERKDRLGRDDHRRHGTEDDRDRTPRERGEVPGAHREQPGRALLLPPGRHPHLRLSPGQPLRLPRAGPARRLDLLARPSRRAAPDRSGPRPGDPRERPVRGDVPDPRPVGKYLLGGGEELPPARPVRPADRNLRRAPRHLGAETGRGGDRARQQKAEPDEQHHAA